jgi:glycosyltransferase involved in cell wall biosynthesis
MRLARWARKAGIEVIHTHLTGAARTGLSVARALGIPVFSHLHIYRADDAYRRVALNGRGGLVGVSRHVAAFYEESFGLPTGSVPVVLNATLAARHPDATLPRAAASAALKAELGLPAEAQTIFLAGRLSEGKAQDVALHALKRLLADFPQARLVLAGVEKKGSGVEARLRKLAAELGVTERVCFLGFRRDTVRLMRAADVCIVPSRFDVMPLVAVEAMSLGCCLVTSRVCGLPEIVEDGVTGLLVPPGDGEALGMALSGLFANPARIEAMREGAARFAAGAFDPLVMARKVESLYKASVADPA